MNLSIGEMNGEMADAIRRVRRDGERIVLKRRGKRVAALVPVEDLELLQKMEDESDIRAALKARKEKGFVTLEQVKARLGMK